VCEAEDGNCEDNEAEIDDKNEKQSDTGEGK
jgi:hypothetical protein